MFNRIDLHNFDVLSMMLLMQAVRLSTAEDEVKCPKPGMLAYPQNCRGVMACFYNQETNTTDFAGMWYCDHDKVFSDAEGTCVPQKDHECKKSSKDVPVKPLESEHLSRDLGCPDGPGIFCINCTHLQVCKRNADSSASPAMVHRCSLNQDTPHCDSKLKTCSGDSHSCKKMSSLKSPGGSKFQCPGIGRFPDPTSRDFRNYYICNRDDVLGLKAKLYVCPAGQIFFAQPGVCAYEATGNAMQDMVLHEGKI